MAMDHSDERRRLVGLRGDLDSAVRSLGDGADRARLIGLDAETDDLRNCQARVRMILKNVEERLERR